MCSHSCRVDALDRVLRVRALMTCCLSCCLLFVSRSGIYLTRFGRMIVMWPSTQRKHWTEGRFMFIPVRTGFTFECRLIIGVLSTPLSNGVFMDGKRSAFHSHLLRSRKNKNIVGLCMSDVIRCRSLLLWYADALKLQTPRLGFVSTTEAEFRLKVEIGIFSCQHGVNKFDLVVVLKADSWLKYGGPRLNRGVGSWF